MFDFSIKAIFAGCNHLRISWFAKDGDLDPEIYNTQVLPLRQIIISGNIPGCQMDTSEVGIHI